MIGQTGQAFDSFNLLIGAVLALTILAIIVGAINYFEGKKVDVSSQKMNDAYMNAVRQPTGQPLLVTGILFEANSRLSSTAVSRVMGIPDKCIEFVVNTPGISVVSRTSPEVVQVNDRVLTDVVMTCYTNKSSAFSFPSDCEIGCTITFGQ